MQPSLTDRLCTHCALCCDGTLFADVELAGRKEATGLEAIGLEVEDDDGDGALLVLPCRALQGKRCGIYVHRPQCCRTFECGLLQNVRRGAAGVEQAERHIADALARVGRVKTLLAQLGHRAESLSLKERVADALAKDAGTSLKSDRTRAELEAEMSALEMLILRTFLGGGKRDDTATRQDSG